MTDLHCHLLPGVDDGAKDVEMSLELLRQEQRQGVTNIVFTSHFRPDREDLHDFLKSRNNAFKTLMEAVEEDGTLDFSYKLGAEVYFSPKLSEIDTELLCFTRTPYLLLEFPFTREPPFLNEVLFQLQARGIRPIIAHVERYTWLYDRPDILFNWVRNGIILQSNASSLLREGERSKYIERLIRWNYVRVLSTDAHHPERRPAELGAALVFVAEQFGKDKARELLQNGNKLFVGAELPEPDPKAPKKRFGKWV